MEPRLACVWGEDSRLHACRGILIKGGRVLDALVQCSTIAFDKTGTLTTGNLSCTALLTPGAPAQPHSSNGAPSC